MTAAQMIIILLFSGFTGWLVSWFTLQIIFSNSFKKSWQTMAGSIIQQQFDSSSLIDDKISDRSQFEKLKPEIEKHVDIFLNEKLATVFPLLYKFMGEKTLSQFKNAFMIEIDLLFPVIIKNYMSNVKKEIRLDEIISDKIENISAGDIRHSFIKYAAKEVFYYRLACTVIGLFLGVLMLGIIIITKV